ncbi:MAG: ATP-binding domain-containing protein [Deltaproteobacteria bacterium]|nr:ATP-binding domain-containing protein [Deltaproteobacteria bacterium]
MVHKFQGSEAKCVVMSIKISHYAMPIRNLLYTALTHEEKGFSLWEAERHLTLK